MLTPTQLEQKLLPLLNLLMSEQKALRIAKSLKEDVEVLLRSEVNPSAEVFHLFRKEVFRSLSKNSEKFDGFKKINETHRNVMDLIRETFNPQQLQVPAEEAYAQAKIRLHPNPYSFHQSPPNQPEITETPGTSMITTAFPRA